MKLRYYWATTLSLFFVLTILDHLVNSTFYKHGLIFSYDWFLVYGACMFLLRAFCGLRLGFIVYENSHPQVRLWKSSAVMLTELSLWMGGYLDFIWFIIDGAFPSMEKIWWWMPQSHFIFEYNIFAHSLYTLGWILILAAVWYTVIKWEKQVVDN